MNKKKLLEKRIYKKGLMTGEERAEYKEQKAEEDFYKKKLSNKKLKR